MFWPFTYYKKKTDTDSDTVPPVSLKNQYRKELEEFYRMNKDIRRWDRKMERYAGRKEDWFDIRSDVGRRKFGAVKRRLFKFLLGEKVIQEPVDYFEFGVSYGDTTRLLSILLSHLTSRLFCFDTFTGLPEDWIIDNKIHRPKGAFSVGGRTPAELGKVHDNRVRFIAGRVEKTLPEFLKTYENRPKLVNLDLDIYSGTLSVLNNMSPYLLPDDVILFDEFLVPEHEFRAYKEFVETFHYKLTPLGRGFDQFVFRVSEK